MRMCSSAATPVPTMTAVGVASPNAHGHAMTITVIAKSSASEVGPVPEGYHENGTCLCETMKALNDTEPRNRRKINQIENSNSFDAYNSDSTENVPNEESHQ